MRRWRIFRRTRWRHGSWRRWRPRGCQGGSERCRTDKHSVIHRFSLRYRVLFERLFSNRRIRCLQIKDGRMALRLSALRFYSPIIRWSVSARANALQKLLHAKQDGYAPENEHGQKSERLGDQGGSIQMDRKRVDERAAQGGRCI